MKKYGLHNKLTAVKGKGDELAAMLLEAARLVANAKGCQLYLISRDPQNEEAVWVTEVWDSKEDHGNSLKIESVRALISKAMPLIGAPPERGIELEVLGGTGLK